MSNIVQHYITTKAGNTLSVFYNPDNDLLVIDLVHKSEAGGCEIVRRTLNEKEILKGVPKSIDESIELDNESGNQHGY